MDTNNDMVTDYVFPIDPKELRGFSITGIPSNTKYRDILVRYKYALSDIDYTFASIIQVHKKGVIDNSFPTLAVAYDNAQIENFEQYLNLVSQISNKIFEATKDLELPINLLVIDRNDNFLNHFKKSGSWIVSINREHEELFSGSKKSWWKFW